MDEHNIYISHAWGGESEKVVQEIYRKCTEVGLNVTLDRKDLGYRESITTFMQNLGCADAIILVVSNKYLHSEYCMYELLQIYENKNILQRIFPVVLDEVSIAKSTERLDLVKYWENETENLETKIRELRTLAYIEGITDDLNLYQKIRNNIANLTRILKDINTLNIRLHRNQDYLELIKSIQSYLNEVKNQQTPKTAPAKDISIFSDHVDDNTTEVTDSSSGLYSSSEKERKWWNKLFVWLPGVLLLGFAMFWWMKRESAELVDSTWMEESSKAQFGTISGKKSILGDTMMNMDGPDPATTRIQQQETDDRPPVNAETDVKNVLDSHPPQVDREGKSVDPPSSLSVGPIRETSPSEVVNGKSTLMETGKEVSQLPTDENYEEQPDYKVEQLFVPESEITVLVVNEISSNQVQEGDIIYLETIQSIVVQDFTVVDKASRVKAQVIQAKSSINGSRAALGIRLEALETVDGNWLPINYPDIIDRRRGEIVFNKGSKFEKVNLPSSTINLKVFQ